MKITLRAARVNISMSAFEVAQLLGIHHQTLLKYENDSSNIPIGLLKQLSSIYKIPMDDIFLGNRFDLKRIQKKENEKEETE